MGALVTVSDCDAGNQGVEIITIQSISLALSRAIVAKSVPLTGMARISANAPTTVFGVRL